jgi:hypothetical protein
MSLRGFHCRGLVVHAAVLAGSPMPSMAARAAGNGVAALATAAIARTRASEDQTKAMTCQI